MGEGRGLGLGVVGVGALTKVWCAWPQMNRGGWERRLCLERLKRRERGMRQGRRAVDWEWPAEKGNKEIRRCMRSSSIFDQWRWTWASSPGLQRNGEESCLGALHGGNMIHDINRLFDDGIEPL